MKVRKWKEEFEGLTAETVADIVRVTCLNRAARKGVKPLEVDTSGWQIPSDGGELLDLIEGKIRQAEEAAGWDKIPDLPLDERRRRAGLPPL
jgi:hypothetical protein